MIIDIDGTILPKSLEFWFLSFLLKTKRISRWNLIKNILIACVLKPRLRWYKFKLMYLRGCSEEQVAQWIQLCYRDYIEPQLYKSIIQCITWLQDSGSVVVLLSGTIRQLATPLAEYLHISKVLCAEPEIKNNRYTGSLLAPHPHGKVKLQYAETQLKKLNFTWSRTIVIADHWQDRFLLSKASLGILISPQKRVRKLAKSKKWFIEDDPDTANGIISFFNEFWQRK